MAMAKDRNGNAEGAIALRPCVSLTAEERQRKNLERQWREEQHGIYCDLPNELSFFRECKRSDNFVLLFYKDSGASRADCLKLDQHLQTLAPMHVETKFRKISANRAKFLVRRLHIKVFPTLMVMQRRAILEMVEGMKPHVTAATVESRLAMRKVVELVTRGENGEESTVEVASNGKERRKRFPTMLVGGRTYRYLEEVPNDSDSEEEESEDEYDEEEEAEWPSP